MPEGASYENYGHIATSAIAKQEQNLQTYYNVMRGRFTDVYNHYNLAYSIIAPKDYPAYRPPTARDLPESLTGALTPQDYTVDVLPFTKKSGKEQSFKQSASLAGFHKTNLKRLDDSTNFSLLGEYIKNLILYGMTSFKGPFVNKEWVNEPEDEDEKERWMAWRQTASPFSLYVVDPLNLLPDPVVFAGGKPNYIIESYDVLSASVAFQFPNTYFPTDEDRNNPIKKVKFIVYWDLEKQVYLADGIVVHEDENPYNFIPYDIRFSGLGKNSPYGDPEDKATGIMWPILPSIRMEAQFMTMLNTVTMIDGVPPVRASKALEGEPIDMTPGAVNYLDEPLEPLFTQRMQAGKEIFDGLALVDRQIERSTFGRSLTGQRQPGVGSGYHFSMIIAQSKKKFSSLVKSAELAWSTVAARCADITENLIEEDVNEEIKWDKIKGYYKNTVKFDIADPEELNTNIEKILKLQGVLSNRTLLDTFPVVQVPDDEPEQKLLEKAMNTDVVIGRTAEQISGQSGAEAQQKTQGLPKMQPFTPSPFQQRASNQQRTPVEETEL